MNPERERIKRRRIRAAALARRAENRNGKRRCASTAKTRFASFDQAVAAALRLSHTLGRPIRPYACADCGGWHLTRRPTWKDPS